MNKKDRETRDQARNAVDRLFNTIMEIGDDYAPDDKKAKARSDYAKQLMAAADWAMEMKRYEQALTMAEWAMEIMEGN